MANSIGYAAVRAQLAIVDKLSDLSDESVEKLGIQNPLLKVVANSFARVIINFANPKLQYDNNFEETIVPLMKRAYDHENGVLKALTGMGINELSNHKGKKEVIEKISSKEVRAKIASDPLLCTMSPLVLKHTMTTLMNLGSYLVPSSWNKGD